MATQASEQSGNHFIENVRPSLLRGGRLTKFKGQAVSLAPMFGGAAMVLMSSAAMIFSGSAAVAGSCAETTPGSGVWICTGAANSGADVTLSPAALAGGALSVTTSPGFGVDTSGTGGNAINLYTSTGDTNISFTDANAALVKSNNDGIVALNNGTGTTSVTVSGIVTGNSAGGNFGADGIRVQNASTATDIAISAASSTGGRSGIFALNGGTGATSIAATAYVKGLTFDGIYARNTNAASMGGLTISAQKVTGGRYGIRADNAGAGAISVTATGAVAGGATTDGIALRGNTTSTDFTVVATDVTGARFGIDARNTGTGATSVTTTGTVTGGSNDGITALTNGTNITVNAGGVTGGRYGILARNFGTGTTSVTASGTVTGTGNDGIGIIAGASTTGATVSAVAVTGKDDGISVTNSGSGSTSITATGAVAGTGRGGIFAYNRIFAYYNPAAAALTVNAAAVTGKAFGIYAKNKGTGATSVTTSGLVTGTNSTGIDARNSSSIGVGGLTINTAAVTGGLYGIRARNYGNGATGITASGPVTGGATSSGIDVQNASTASTSLTISAGAVSGGRYGVTARNSGSGAINITTAGAVSGANYAGIYALNGSGGTSLGINAQGSVTGGSDGIQATNTGTGALTVSLGGNVTGTTGQGLNAFNSANAGTSNMVINQALGTTTSGALNGILAINYATSGALTINASGASVATGTFGGNGVHAINTGTDMNITANIATGITNGVFARNTGTGATSVAVTGSATGAGQSGIYAKGNGTSLSVSAVTVSGGTYGILARNSGTGSTSITATGAVSGASSGGIYVNTYNGSSAGDVTVVVQAVSGGGHGIYVNNAGYGATSFTATGAVIGSGNSGIYTRSAGTNLGVTATDASGAANGIYARNSGIGTTSVTATGTVSGTAGHGIYARGSGTDLTVSAATVTGAQDGIHARNLGYGANSVTATGTVTGGLAYDGILATNSSTGTDLTVSSAAVSGGVWGIHARNNGYGATSVTSTGLVISNTYEGIYASNSGTSLGINAQADVVGGRDGIKAVNLGTAGLTISASGNVTGVSGEGINAFNSAYDVTASMVINQAAGTATVGALNGILANNLGGSLTVNALGNSVAYGGDAIKAINSTGTTNLNITANIASGSNNGIYARNSGTGTTSITTTGAITGTGIHGIFARNNAATGALTISTAAAVTGKLFGIGVSNYSANGAVSITSSGNVSGGGTGIDARSYYTAVNIATTGAVTGTTGDGIFALAKGTGMTVNTGAVTGGLNGIRAINTLANGTIDMTVNGAVAGGTGYGIYTKTTGFSSNSTINLNAGAAVSATSGKAIYNGAGNSNITVNSGASVTGRVSLGNGSDTLTFAGGDFSAVTVFDGGDDTTSTDGFIDTLNFNGAGGALLGANIQNWENVSIGAGAAVSFVDTALSAGALTVAAGGVLSGAGNTFFLTGDMANAGTVNMQNASTGDSVSVSGDYTGGGALLLDVDTSLDTADTLAITGNSSGTTLITLNNLTPLVATGNDITLVTVGGTSLASDFALAGGAITAGAFDYDLSYLGGSFILAKQLNSVGVTYLASPMAFGEFNRLGSLAQRIEGRKKTDGRVLWASVSGRSSQVSLTNGSTTDSRLWGLQVGADLEFDPGNAGRWVLGFTGQYGSLSTTVTDPVLGFGTTSTNGYGIGLTATWYGNNGGYVDTQAQVSWLNSDISSSSSGVLVQGLNSRAYALSVEGGQRIMLGSNTAIVPQAQLSWGSTSVDSFTDSVGNSVDLGSNNSLVGRIGIAYEFALTPDAQKLYVIGSVLHDFSSDSAVTIAGVTTSTALASPTSAEFGFGGKTRIGAVALYGEAGIRTALDGSNDLAYSGTFGLSMKF